MNSFIEGELKFTIQTGLVKHFDIKGVPQPQNWKRIDYIIEEEKYTVFLEIKDYAAATLEDKDVTENIKKLQSDGYINEVIVPKARDSYCFQHLMKEDRKPYVYLVVIGLDKRYYNEAEFDNLKDKIKKRINLETDRPWERKYIKDCFVLPCFQLNKVFPEYEVARIKP